MKRDRIRCFSNISAGYPSFSYSAMKNIGSMMSTMAMAATVVDTADLIIKKDGTPKSAAVPKQMICRFVKFKNTFVRTFERSRGTDTYAAILSSF